MSLETFRTELQTALATAIPRYQPYESDKINAPCGELVIGRGVPDDYDGSITYDGAVRFYAGRTAEVAAQKLIDDLIDPTQATAVFRAIKTGTYSNADAVECFEFL